MTHERTPGIGELLRLKMDGGNLYFLPEKEDGTEIVVDVGWTFEISEPLSYLDSGAMKQVGSGRARLEAIGDLAVFYFDEGTCVPLENIRPTATVRAKLISRARWH